MFVNILPPDVRRKIAAGEVIESPSDAVKELVENSLDAGASQIDIEVSKGGKRLIYVKDNGTGIHPQDIEKVILEGATSKIRDEKDLLRIDSYGFRGEALYSLASVSRLTIRSRFFQEKVGRVLRVEGGKVVDVSEAGMQVGTQVEVKDLFYNLPVRRKFLRREDTETRKITEVVREYALANPSVGFSLYSNGREVLFLRPSERKDRVEELFSAKFESIEEEKEYLKLTAYIRRNVKQGKFYIFVNSRPVSSKTLKEFLKKSLGYKTLGVIFLELPPFMVDFNIHPKKKEVKFLKERKTLSLIREALTSKKVEINFLAQEVPKYGEEPSLVGQLDDTFVLFKMGDYLYILDQHLVSERYNYEKLGGSTRAEEIACRISLKAGQKLSEKQMKELLEMWKSLENPHVCPHGRPIYYRIHLKDIYEKLGRSY